MPIVGLLVGAVVGLWLDRGFDVVMGGAFVGLIAGLIFGAWRKRGAPAAASAPTLHPAGDRIAALELRLARVETALDRAGMMAPATALAGASASGPGPIATAAETGTTISGAMQESVAQAADRKSVV